MLALLVCSSQAIIGAAWGPSATASNSRPALKGRLFPSHRLIERTNPIELHGSLPLLGVRANVVMAHGTSNRQGVQAAIAQAVQTVRGGVVDKLKMALAETRDHLSRAGAP